MENVLACDLTVICRNKERHEGVNLRVTDDAVEFVTAEGLKLEGETAVELIDKGNFLMPAYLIEKAIVKYRGQR